ncbi:MAG: hypothetical protein PUP92_25270 [Rhizonema sp. PD38]|nr:hypothetical protein [Rhizonema sp. PD38]
MEISSERIDDIPVVVEWLKQMGIAKCIDQCAEHSTDPITSRNVLPLRNSF